MLIKELSGEIYKKFIDYVASKSEFFSLTMQEDFNKLVTKTLQELINNDDSFRNRSLLLEENIKKKD